MATAEEIAATVAEAVDPMVDLQANADYKRQLVRVLGARVVSSAFADVTHSGGRLMLRIKSDQSSASP